MILKPIHFLEIEIPVQIQENFLYFDLYISYDNIKSFILEIIASGVICVDIEECMGRLELSQYFMKIFALKV